MTQAMDDQVVCEGEDQSRQAGHLMLEAVLSVALAAFVAVGLNYAIKEKSEAIKLAGIASEMSMLRIASDHWVQDNFASLIQTTRSRPVWYSARGLATATNYLPPSFSGKNAFGQAYYVLVRQRSDKVLESMVVALGGTSMTPSEGGAVAKLMKTQGGYVAVGSDVAVGLRGSWTAPLKPFLAPGVDAPSGSAVAYSIHYSVTGPTGALIRYATGNPADNRMSTDLDMGGNSINNVANLGVGTVNASDVVSTNVSTNTLTIDGQRLSLSDAQTLSALTAASCGTGYALTKSGSSLYCVAMPSVPSGVIAGFDGDCPSGWKSFTPGIGRVLIGAGSQGPSVPGYAVGEKGGQAGVTLTVDQLPNHNHHMFADSGGRYDTIQRYPDAAPNRGASGSSSGASYNIGANTNGQSATLGTTESVGGGKPFDNRPPFVAVNFCQRQ